MLEIKITLETPGLSEAINNLATAIAGNGFGAVATQAAVQTNPTSAQTAPAVTAPTATPTTTAPPVNTPAAAPSEKAYTLAELSTAGAALCENGKMPQLVQLLAQFGAQTVTQIKPEQYPALAQGLKTLGAKL